VHAAGASRTWPLQSISRSRPTLGIPPSGYDGTVRLWETGGGTYRRTVRGERRYERMDITGLTGITDTQRAALLAPRAVEKKSAASAVSIGS
jgi:hypothetical protein